MNEFGIISKYFKPLSNGNKCALGLEDDAAIISCDDGYELVVTKDTIVDGIHFFSDDSPYDIAKKLLGINLSDLASMGAKPAFYLLSLAVPSNINEEWIEQFCEGFASMQAEYGGNLIGGDTVATKHEIVLTLTAIGKINKGQAIKRSGAQQGDLIFVSGTIGDSYLGLQILQKKLESSNSEYLKSRYHIPNPRVKLGQKLIGLANAATDISDGLVADLANICQSSGVGAKIYLDKIPLSDAAKEHQNIIEELITAGDDYELLFTVPAIYEEAIRKISEEIKLPVTQIGLIEGNELEVIDNGGNVISLDKKGYSHF